MTSLESIEKLRTIARNMAKGSNLENHEECNLLLITADEIEREIAERYMELPEGWTAKQASEVLDLWPRWDDGSPCMFGDEFTCYPKYDMKEKYEVFERLTIYWKSHVWNRGEHNESPHHGGFYEWNYMRPGGDNCEEYRPTKRKPRTVEDVLRDFLDEKVYTSKTYERYADEIRELMGGGR